MIPIMPQFASVGKDGGVVSILLFGPGSRAGMAEVYEGRGDAYIREELVVDIGPLGADLVRAIQHECCAGFYAGSNH